MVAVAEPWLACVCDGMDAATKLQTAREAAGKNQAELARAVGVARSTIGKWEDGRGRPTLEQWLSISRTLGRPIEWFADPDMDEPPAVGLGEDERLLLRVWRALGLSAEDAVARLSIGGPARVVAVRGRSMPAELAGEPEGEHEPARQSQGRPPTTGRR